MRSYYWIVCYSISMSTSPCNNHHLAVTVPQVHNALGYCYLNMEKVAESVTEFQKAVELQPGYVTAWNNLGDAYERTKSWR